MGTVSLCTREHMLVVLYSGSCAVYHDLAEA